MKAASWNMGMVRGLCLFVFAAFLFGWATAFAEAGERKSGGFQIEPAVIQKSLAEAGFYKGEIDGIIGSRTKSAIRAFQEANGLRADGVCGPNTWEKLKAFSQEAVSQDISSEAVIAGDTAIALQDQAGGSSSNTDLKQKLVP